MKLERSQFIGGTEDIALHGEIAAIDLRDGIQMGQCSGIMFMGRGTVALGQQLAAERASRQTQIAAPVHVGGPGLKGTPERVFSLEELATRQIPVEICLTSNLRTGACASLSAHPVRQYFDQGIMITLNTDDPAMFRTSLSREYQLAQQSFGFTDEHLRELARNSFEASFLPAEKKLTFLNLFDAAAAHT